MERSNANRKNARGFTLLISMVLLIVMSLVGIVAVNMAVEETKIAQNYAESLTSMVWAEAGIEAARQVILSSANEETPVYDCDPSNELSFHYCPDSANRKARYCIEFIKHELGGADEENRGSPADAGKQLTTYYYKIDSYVERETGSGDNVVIRHVQSIEQQARYSAK